MSDTAAFFHEMAPTLTANLLTVTVVYCIARVSQSERRGEEGHFHHLSLVVMVLLSALYGLYTWRS
jgi:hypothetical protein